MSLIDNLLAHLPQELKPVVHEITCCHKSYLVQTVRTLQIPKVGDDINELWRVIRVTHYANGISADVEPIASVPATH